MVVYDPGSNRDLSLSNIDIGALQDCDSRVLQYQLEWNHGADRSPGQV